MSIATYQHDKKSAEKGALPIFIVNMPFAVTRKMLGVQFVEGTAYTKYEVKAKEFDENYGYEIVLPKGHKGWELASSKATHTAEEPGLEDYVDTGEEPLEQE